jgi:hypothetical protein
MLGALLACQLPARACSPVPPPPREAGESDSDYWARLAGQQERQLVEGQRWAWDGATSVARVRIVRLRSYGSGRYAGSNGAFVRVLGWTKGKAGGIPFEFRPIGPCFGEDTVADGKIGETFLVFFSGPRPQRNTILSAWRTDLVRDPRMLGR